MAATDYWLLCDAGLRALLISELTTLFPDGTKQVTASDDTVLDSGKDNFAITYPGAFPQTEEAAGFVTYSWEILLELATRWNKTESKAWNENGFKNLRSEVIYLINHTRAGRTLGGVNFVRNAIMSAEERPSYIPVNAPDGSVIAFSHIRQVCIVTVDQMVPRETI